MFLPGKRVIGQYVYYDSTDEAIRVSQDAEWGKDLLNLINDPIMITDAKGNIMLVNDSFARMRRVKKEYLINQNVKSFDPPSRVCDVLKTKRAIRGISQRDDDGSIYIVEALPILQDENLKGVILIAKNISVMEKIDHAQDGGNDFQNDNYIEFVGKDMKIIKLKEKIDKIAKSDLAVLITGETGSGKELVAKSIHTNSNRSDAPFVAINCSALSSNLIESELFGYDDGAFTGAKKGGKAGLLEVANGGTLFLDEIGDMPLDFQPKLLRALEEYSIRRVGSNNKRFIDIRLIAATNKRIDELSLGSSFRMDLYYRLKGVNLHVPSLRERKDDIPVLIRHFLKKLNVKTNRSITISPSAMFYLMAYKWPGNVRELKNTVESLFFLCESGLIRKSDLPNNLIGDMDDYKDRGKNTGSVTIVKNEFDGRRLLLLDYLKSTEYITNKIYCGLTKVNRVTAYRDLSRLVSEGVLTMVGMGRSVKYRYTGKSK